MFTQEDNKQIEDAYNGLLDCASKLIGNDEEKRAIVQKAFDFANSAHHGVRRKSGEPYILHPISVARIVVEEIGLGVKSMCASLLHDVVEDTDYTVEDLEAIFGSKVATMVDGLTKLKKAGDIASTNSEQAENFKKMIFTLSDDVRVIIIKLADRLHNVRTLDSILPHKKVKVVSETLFLFVPLAHRLGLAAIKSELENLCFKHSYPEDFFVIERKMNETSIERQKFIDRFVAPINKILVKEEYDFVIEGREKSPFSVWKKMQKKNISFEEVFDLFAIRVIFKANQIVAEKQECWTIFSNITDIYTPKPDRLRDWVSIPKANGYEALHCTFMGPDGFWVEVQIRSERMNNIAEKGFAAHWKYKGDSEIEGELDKWIGQIRDALNSPVEDAVQFLDDFKMNLYTTEIVVFTPNGESRMMPKGATVLDFAYDIHSNLGNCAIGAKINHVVRPIFSKLKSGDQVEIISSKKSEPKIEWLDKVVTVKAKNYIKMFLKRSQVNFVERGKEIFLAELLKFEIKQSNTRILQKVLPEYECSAKDEFYSKIGSGIIKLDNLGQILKSSKSNKLLNFWSLDLVQVNPFKLFGGGGNKAKEDTANQEYITAECCHPIPQDEIAAFKGDEDQIIIHKKNCAVAIDLAAKYADRIVKANWTAKASMSYLCKIKLTGIDRVGILYEVSQITATQFSVNIRNLLFETHNTVFECNIVLYVKDSNALKQLMKLMQTIKGVNTVRRVEFND